MKSKTGKATLIIVGAIIGLVILNIALTTVFEMDNTIASKWSLYDKSVNESSYNDYELQSAVVSNAEKVITRNRITIETRNISKTVSSIEELIEAFKGKVINKSVDLGDARYGSITLKIPSNKGNEFVDRLNKEYDVSSYSTDVEDVTEQYFNTEKEIQNLQRKIKLYEELANQTPIKEIETRIQVIDKIHSLENQIEYLQEQKDSIDEKVDYRDVVITLSAPDKIQGERNYWHNTIQMVILTLEGSLRVLVAIVAISVPFALLFGLPVIVYKKIKKK